MAVTRLEFGVAVLNSLGAPSGPRWRGLRNRRALVAWMQAEGSLAEFNPLGTTLAEPGATDYNNIHVKNYVDLAQGVSATADTLRESRYETILHCLHSGDYAGHTLAAVADSDWGTGNLALACLPEVRADIAFFGGKLIGQ